MRRKQSTASSESVRSSTTISRASTTSCRTRTTRIRGCSGSSTTRGSARLDRARRHPTGRPEDEEFDLRARRPPPRRARRRQPFRRADDLHRRSVRQGAGRVEADPDPDGGAPAQFDVPGADLPQGHGRRERRRACARGRAHRRPSDHGQEPAVQPESLQDLRGRPDLALGRRGPGEARRVWRGPADPGGYFIIGGTERVIISLEDLAPNRIFAEYNERYGTPIPRARRCSASGAGTARSRLWKRRRRTASSRSRSLRRAARSRSWS